jgi:hypothetical protein
MGGGLVIIEPTTILRDWARTALALPELWAGGWPQTSTATIGVVLELVTSTVDGPVTTWTTQWDAYATTAGGGQPAASALVARLATLLLRTPPRTLLGSSAVGQVLYGGAVDTTVAISPVDSDEPDVYRSQLLCDLLTIAIPTP